MTKSLYVGSMMHPKPPLPAPVAVDFAVVRLGEGDSAQVAIGALPRQGRLPLGEVNVLGTHIELMCADGVVEHLGSPVDPLEAEVLAQARTPEGLWFAEIDETSGLPLSTERLVGAAR